MPASSCEFSPIDVHLPSANSVISDTALESSTSPSSLAVDDEQLTVRPHFTLIRPLSYLFPQKANCALHS